MKKVKKVNPQKKDIIMKTKTEQLVITKDLRQTLKSILQQEVENLPSRLDELEPKDRLNVLCKLIPFVFPRVNSVSHTANEPMDFWS